jgi:Tol biopolymer transport system component
LDFGPDWSPGGTKIAFTRFANSLGQIYTMNADGSGQTRVSGDPPVPEIAPVWSPDGTKIAFTRYVQGNGQIYTMSPDGSALTNLSTSSTYDQGSDWQPIPGPQRSDYKNAAKFCKAERAFLGDAAFARKYGSHGKCVSGK